MTSQKDIAKKQAEIVGQLQQFPIGRTNSGGRAGGTVEVVVTSPLPGQPRVVQAKCANDCPPGEVQLLRADDGSYVALSRSAAQKTSETTTRQVSKKNPTIPKKDKEIWPCIVGFLYSRIKPNQEDLTDNMATDKTSWDVGDDGYAGQEKVNLFFQRADELGDYLTGNDALANNLKDDRKLKPGGSGAGDGGGADDAAWNSGSADGVRVWFYIGDPANMASVATTSKIIDVSGPPMHPSSGNIKNSGPGYCLIINSAGISSAIFPDEGMGSGPLTKELKKSFPNLGGRIGYWGGIAKWGGEKDYASGVSYFRHTPFGSEPAQTPTSFPVSYIPGTSQNPWLQTNYNWFQFGWGTAANPMYIGCIVSSHVNVETSAITALSCGAAIPPESWFWGGDTAPYAATLDKYRFGWNGYNNLMYVCWQGHKDNISLAQSFFEAFRVYWGLPGSVVKLASCGRFGCEIGPPEGGGGYPQPPPGLPRFLVKAFGRKAEIWLKVCRQNDPPLELKLPLEFVAIIEKYIVQGNAGISSPNQPSESVRFNTYGSNYNGAWGQRCLENPHATLSMNGEFAYINISYGGKRIWEEPLSRPIQSLLGNLGAGTRVYGRYRTLGSVERFLYSSHPGIYGIVGEYKPAGLVLSDPLYKKDCFSYCECFVVKLPTATSKTLTIVGYQRYARGELITLTANSPDTEFDQNYLICDFRTSKLELNESLVPGNNGIVSQWQKSNPEYVGFGGLPALIQFPHPGYTIQANTILQYMPRYYKPESVWTAMDKVHNQLQESPRIFSPLSTVLPPNVFPAVNFGLPAVIFDLDGKFGRGGRPELIDFPNNFGDNGANAYEPNIYNSATRFTYPHLISYKEQLVGNGLIKNGVISKWYRVTNSSFPIGDQTKRNYP